MRTLRRGMHLHRWAHVRFGGWDETKRELSDLWEFRVRTATWSLLPPCCTSPSRSPSLPATCVPSARTGSVLVAQPSQDRLLLFGGCDASQQYAELYEYQLPDRRHASSHGSHAHSERRHRSNGKSSSHRGEEETGRGESTRRSGSQNRGGGSSERKGAAVGEAGKPTRGGWRTLEMSGVPPARRSNHVMLTDESGRVLVYGGFDGSGFLGDLQAAVFDEKSH